MRVPPSPTGPPAGPACSGLCRRTAGPVPYLSPATRWRLRAPTGARGCRCCPCSSRRRRARGAHRRLRAPTLGPRCRSSQLGGDHEPIRQEDVVQMAAGNAHADRPPVRPASHPTGAWASRCVRRFSHDDVPCKRQSTGFCRWTMWSRHTGSLRDPCQAWTQTHGDPEHLAVCRSGAPHHTGRCAVLRTPIGQNRPVECRMHCRTCGNPDRLLRDLLDQEDGPTDPGHRRARRRRPAVEPAACSSCGAPIRAGSRERPGRDLLAWIHEGDGRRPSLDDASGVSTSTSFPGAARSIGNPHVADVLPQPRRPHGIRDPADAHPVAMPPARTSRALRRVPPSRARCRRACGPRPHDGCAREPPSRCSPGAAPRRAVPAPSRGRVCRRS